MDFINTKASFHEIRNATDSIGNAVGKIKNLLGLYAYSKKEEEKVERECENKNFWIKVAMVIGGITLICGIAYALYKYFTPDYLEDYDDDFDDKFDDDFFDDEDEEEKVEAKEG